MTNLRNASNGPNHNAVAAGAQSDLPMHRYIAPNGFCVVGKVFLSEALGASGAEISWNVLVPGEASPLLHRHRENEEIYLFTGGRGEFRVDETVFAVDEGTAVRVAPQGARACRNTGDAPLTFIAVQARPGTLGATTIADGVPLGAVPAWPARPEPDALDHSHSIVNKNSKTLY